MGRFALALAAVFFALGAYINTPVHAARVDGGSGIIQVLDAPRGHPAPGADILRPEIACVKESDSLLLLKAAEAGKDAVEKFIDDPENSCARASAEFQVKVIKYVAESKGFLIMEVEVAFGGNTFRFFALVARKA